MVPRTSSAQVLRTNSEKAVHCSGYNQVLEETKMGRSHSSAT